ELDATGADPSAAASELPQAVSKSEELGSAVMALPDCPAQLGGYAELLPQVLAAATGDQELVENWLQGCGAFGEGRGAVVMADLNGDAVKDAIVYPTLIADNGFGPGGAQGAVL